MKILGLLLVAFSFVFGAVDINSANVKELGSLKGIGKKFLEKNRKYLSAGVCKK